MIKQISLAIFLLALACMSASHAADDAPDTSAAEASAAEQLQSSLQLKTGKIELPGGKAVLNLPDTFRYLNPTDTEKVLVQGWGNPPGYTTLGMIVPADVNLMSKEGWGVIVTYEGDGHVADKDADTIDYTKMLREMQEGMEESNAERKQQGYAPMHLVGWAERPSYDKASHKLYWAKELRTDGDTDNGLNYNIRVLGREGVLVLNAVSAMSQLDDVRREMRKVTAFSDFTPGNRYADFNESTDKTAGYGIAALVAGSAAAKLGLFGKLFAFLLAFKKLLIVGVGVLGMGIWNFFRGRSGKVNLDK